MSELKIDDSLITGASLTPQPDEGCVNTCYYVGWSWDHTHDGGGHPDPPENPSA